MSVLVTPDEGGTTTRYTSDDGALLVLVYEDDGHWYAVDVEGEDIPGGWHHDDRQSAERAALAHTKDLTR